MPYWIDTAQLTATALNDHWQMALSAEPGADLSDLRTLEWIDAPVPGTAAQALIAAGRYTLETLPALDDFDVWSRRQLTTDRPQRLRFHGLAPIAEVFLDGVQILSATNMFRRFDSAVFGPGTHELLIRFCALNPLAAHSKGRARWRPRMIQPGGMRHIRSTALGHMPGFAPPAPPIGPFRPVELIEAVSERLEISTRLNGDIGEIEVCTGMLKHGLHLNCGGQRLALQSEATQVLRLPKVARWFPHTHGEPALHALQLETPDGSLELPALGFRQIEVDHDTDGHGFGLRINGLPVFCRGAVWTPTDVISLQGDPLPILQTVKAAGFNMLRIPGISLYETPEFYQACDRLGLMVWQDFMFANFDYPIADAAFASEVTAEINQVLDDTSLSPSMSVFCGGSEVYQQAAMLGYDPQKARSPLFETLMPELVRQKRADAAYTVNSPSGGAMPFYSNQGVAHYYGVGAYRRSLADARLAHIRFASECLGFANVPSSDFVRRHFGSEPINEIWNARIPRDQGALQDFEQVRDHYVAEFFRCDVAGIRSDDPALYLRLGRAALAYAMEQTIAEWRRPGSSTRGALVWFLRDLWPSSGWGVFDSEGKAKSSAFALSRAFRQQQIILSDEGVNGLDVHVVNESVAPLTARVTLRCLAGYKTEIMGAEKAIEVPAHSHCSLAATDFWGAFFDTNYAFRFGPAAHDAVVATLRCLQTQSILAEAFYFPTEQNIGETDLGLRAECAREGNDVMLRLSCKKLALWVEIDDPHATPEDNFFHLAPGDPRVITLKGARGEGIIRPLNGPAIRYRIDS